jgi:hypothetical protein
VQDSTGTGLGAGGSSGMDTGAIALNAWRFTANGHQFSGSILTAQFVKLIGSTLVLVGDMKSGTADTAFGLSVQFPDSTIVPGTFFTTDAGTNFQLEKLPSGDVIFAANAVDPPIISVTISGYDTATKTVTGSFSGNSYDGNGNTVPVTNGAFKAQLQ